MIGNVTYKQLRTAEELAKRLRQEADPKLPYRENMARALAKRTDGGAGQIISELLKGVDAGRAQDYKASCHSRKRVMSFELDIILEELEYLEEKQKEVLLLMLSCGADITGENIPEDADADVYRLTNVVLDFYDRYSLVDIAACAEPLAKVDGCSARSLLKGLKAAEMTDYLALALYLDSELTDLTPCQLGAVACAYEGKQKTLLVKFLKRIRFENDV